MLQGSEFLCARVGSPMFAPVQAIRIKEEPISIGRAIPTFEHVVELPEAARGVIEHAIQDNPNILLMSLIEQFPEGFIPAQQWVNRIIIIGVITMVGSGSKDRVEIESRDPQVFQVVEFFGN